MMLSSRPLPLLLAVSGLLASCTSSPKILKPFSSDGCSLFPDASLISDNDWCSCCLTHDLAYWRGGTAEERKSADQALKNCVREKTDSATLATAMYSGVRLGGSPYFPTWFRWGYGWNELRSYAPLTSAERKAADQLQKQYQNSSQPSACPQTESTEPVN